MATRLQDNTFKAIILIMLFLGLMLHTLVAGAQSHPDNSLYRGFVASFGTHAADISSEITQMPENLQQAGGQVGNIHKIFKDNAKARLSGAFHESLRMEQAHVLNDNASLTNL